MDQASLVTEQIDAGLQLIDKFNKYANLQAAFWVRESESGHWYLYLASEQINDSNFDLAYGEIFRIVGKEPDEWLDPFAVKVAGVDDPVVRAVLNIQQKFPSASATRLRNLRLGDLVVDELYLYPSTNAKKSRKNSHKHG